MNVIPETSCALYLHFYCSLSTYSNTKCIESTETYLVLKPALALVINQVDPLFVNMLLICATHGHSAKCPYRQFALMASHNL